MSLTPEHILDPLQDQISSIQLIQSMGDDKMIANAARVSFAGQNNQMVFHYLCEDGTVLENEDLYLSGTDSPAEFQHLLLEHGGLRHVNPDQQFLPLKDARLIKYLLKHHHGSPFEHNAMTFRIVAPVYVVRQWMRHRIGVSYNEISARYTEVAERFYTPAVFRKQSLDNRQASVPDDGQIDQQRAHEVYAQAWRQAHQAYLDLLALGVTREQARGVLPLTMYTEFYFTCNVRSLLLFISLRMHPGAQWEIQQYAAGLKDILRALFPVTMQTWDELNAG